MKRIKKSISILLLITMALMLTSFSSSANMGTSSQMQKKNIKRNNNSQMTCCLDDHRELKSEEKMQFENAFSSHKEGLHTASVVDKENYLEIFSPIPGQIAYSGETLYTNYKVYDTWEDYWTMPDLSLFDAKDNLLDAVTGDIADEDCWTEYDASLSLEGYPEGTYNLMFANVPCYSNGKAVENWSDMGVPSVIIQFYIRELQPPKSVTATTGKGKITLKWPKASGATKYVIYRSTKSNSGFKKIKTTKSRRYVDKKVKKGKRYYYEVASVRNVNGYIESEYVVGPVRSYKVN